MTLETTVPTNLNNLEIGSIPKTPIDLQTLQLRMAQQSPVLASMLALLKKIQADPSYIFSGSTSDFRIEWLSGAIFIGHKDAQPAGLGSGYSGDLRFGISMDLVNGLSIGYNSKVTGVWESSLIMDMSGNKYLLGEHSSGSINGSNVTVSGTTVADIRTGAVRALAAINSSNVVTADVSSSSVYATTFSGTNLSLAGSITGVLGSIAAVGSISSVTTVSAASVVGSVVTASAGLAITSGYITKPWEATGRLTVNEQTSPYAALGTYTYSFHV